MWLVAPIDIYSNRMPLVFGGDAAQYRIYMLALDRKYKGG